MSNHRVAIVAGARTPFVKSGKAFASLGPSALAKHAVRGLLDRHKVNADRIDAIAFGAVVPEPGKPNLAREIVLEAGLSPISRRRRFPRTASPACGPRPSSPTP